MPRQCQGKRTKDFPRPARLPGRRHDATGWHIPFFRGLGPGLFGSVARTIQAARRGPKGAATVAQMPVFSLFFFFFGRGGIVRLAEHALVYDGFLFGEGGSRVCWQANQFPVQRPGFGFHLAQAFFVLVNGNIVGKGPDPKPASCWLRLPRSTETGFPPGAEKVMRARHIPCASGHHRAECLLPGLYDDFYCFFHSLEQLCSVDGHQRRFCSKGYLPW